MHFRMPCQEDKVTINWFWVFPYANCVKLGYLFNAEIFLKVYRKYFVVKVHF